nr:hypothetical protein [Tanacetum cinerariifolium]
MVLPELDIGDEAMYDPIWGCERLVSIAKVIENQVTAIFTILISSDSSEESVGTPSGRVLWFGRIPTIVPVTTPTIDPPVIHDDTLLIPTKTPTISPITSTIPPTAPTTHYTSLFIHIDSSKNDTPDTSPSPTHKIPPIEVAPPAGQILFDVRRRRVTIVSLRQPIPHGRRYRYHPTGPMYMMIARKRVGPLPLHLLAVRHSIDYSLSDYFTFDDSLRDSPSDSSSETPLDSFSDALFDSSSGHSSSDHHHQYYHRRPSHSSSMGPSRKRSRSPTISVPVSSPIPEVLSSVRVDLLPPRRRIRSFDFAMDLEDCLDEKADIDLEIQAEINKCIAYANALRSEGVDARVVVETAAQEEVNMSTRGMVKVRVDRVTHLVVPNDIPDPAQEERAIEVAHETLGYMVHKIVATGQQSAVQLERISELERDNTRLRGMLDVPTRQILYLKGVIPTKTVADAKEAIQEMAEYSQKWHNVTSSNSRRTKTSDGLAAIQAQLKKP